MSEDDPFGDLVPQRLAFPVNAPSQPAPGLPAPSQSAAPVGDDVSFDDLIPSQPMPSVWDATHAGITSAIHGLGQTAETMRGNKPVAEDMNPAAAPLAWSDVASPVSQLAPKIAYRLAEGAPTMAGGIAGAIAGGGLGTVVGGPGFGTAAGALGGGTIGTAATAAAQTLGPYFAQALKESPDKPEEAYTKALHAAELAGVFGGASWALFPVRAFQGPVKQMMFQAFGVQPAVAVAHKASSNVVEGKPVTEDLGQSYAEGATMTALPMAGHAIANKALGVMTRPGVRVPEIQDRIEPVLESFGSRDVQPVADVGAVIEPAEPVVAKKPRGRKKAADLTVETQAGPVEPVMAPEVISPASGAVPFDYASVPRSADRIAALRAELDASQPGSWHQMALQEALNVGTNPEIAKTSVQWASANNRPDIVRMIIEKADTRARDADLHRQQYPELDYWARRARDDASALREANTGAWAEPNTTPLEAIALGRMPQDMLGFIRDRGGIRDTEGELKAIGARDKTGIINNTSGLHPDEMRRILVEQGYLDDVPHDQQTQSTVNDLYDAVGDALNGRKIYRATDADRADMINRTKVKSSEDEKAEASIIMQLKKWHREFDQPYKMTEGDEADIVRRVMDGHDLDTAINDQARDWYNEVYQGIDSRRAPPRGETPVSRGESRDGFEAESRAVEPGTDGTVSGGESGDWWREQNPWSIGRQAPTLDGASRVQDAISRAMHRLPDGVTAQNVRDVGDVRGSVGDRAAEWQRKTGRNIDGTYDRDTGDIYIAHHALNPDAVVGHELFHALRERGLISDDDLHIMAHAAEQIPDLWNKSVYEKAYGRANNKSELMAEEAGAHLYQKRIEGYDFGPRVNSILDRIKAFIERVRNALRGDGFNTSEQVQRAWDEGQDRATSRAVGLRGRTAKDIMDEIDSGQMAQRSQRLDDRAAPNRELDDSLNQNSQSDSPNLMYSFGGERAKTADHEALALAKKMDGQGEGRDAIWSLTGWFKGVDGKWRFEIDDSDAKFKKTEWSTAPGPAAREAMALSDALVKKYDRPWADVVKVWTPEERAKMRALDTQMMSERDEGMALAKFPDRVSHDRLTSAYPEFNDVDVYMRPDMPHKGSFSADVGALSIRPDFVQGAEVPGSKGWKHEPGKYVVGDEHLSTGIHEIGHGIEGLEGFATGANYDIASKSPEYAAAMDRYRNEPIDTSWTSVGADTPESIKDAVYRRYVGEVFSRLAQKRQKMTAEERRARPPWMDYDVPENEQIVRFGSNGPQMSEDGSRERSPSRSVGAVNVPAAPRSIDNLGYYSHALEAARGLRQAKGTPEQMLAQLKSAGVKQAEIEATGLDKFFEEKGRPRAEISPPLGAQREAMSAWPLGEGKAATVGMSSVESWLEMAGIPFKVERSQSNSASFGPSISTYYKVETPGGPKTIRVSDHDYVAPDGGLDLRLGGSADDAIAQIHRLAGKDVPREVVDRLSATKAAAESSNRAKDADRWQSLKPGTREQVENWLRKNGGEQLISNPSAMLESMQYLNVIDKGRVIDALIKKYPQPKKSAPPTVTRDEIASYLDTNRVGVREKTYGRTTPQRTEESMRAIAAEIEKMGVDGITAQRVAEGLSDPHLVQPDLAGVHDSIYNMASPNLRGMIDRARTDVNDSTYRQNSLDPSNPTYRETVIHLPGNKEYNENVFNAAANDAYEAARKAGATGAEANRLLENIGAASENPGQAVAIPRHFETAEVRRAVDKALDATLSHPDFQSGHFPEPNIIGHIQSELVRLGKEDTKRLAPDWDKAEQPVVYVPTQIQSDWGQKLRDDSRNALAQKIYGKRFDDLDGDGRKAVSAEMSSMASRGEKPAGVRDEAKIASLKKQIAEHEADYDQGWLRGAYGDHEKAWTNAQNQLGEQAAIDMGFDADRVQRSKLLDAELRTAEASASGHPLVNTTDQWTITTLRRAIRQAAEADAEYIAIPSGDTVLSYNPGDAHGMHSFYGRTTERQALNIGDDLKALPSTTSRAPVEGIVPKNLRKLLQKLDKDSPAPQRIETLDTPTSGAKGKGFTLFPLTEKVKQAVMDGGLPTFASGGRVPAPSPLPDMPVNKDRAISRALAWIKMGK